MEIELSYEQIFAKTYLHWINCQIGLPDCQICSHFYQVRQSLQKIKEFFK